jgi:hypothetical protein
MMKLIRYFLIQRKTKNPLMAARIYQMIYHPELAHRWEKPHREVSLPNNTTFEGQTQTQLRKTDYRGGNRVLTEREEIEKALRELQLKPKKTPADKVSIGMLEAVLVNM